MSRVNHPGEFRCPEHGVTEHLVRMDGSDEPTECGVVLGKNEPGGPWIKYSTCGSLLERVLSAPASIFPGAGSWRTK